MTIRQAFPTFRQLRYPAITFDLDWKRFEYDPLPHSSGGLYFRLAIRDGGQRIDACFIHTLDLYRCILHHDHRWSGGLSLVSSLVGWFSPSPAQADGNSNNKTTLEDITHTYPSALIEDRPHNLERQPGWRGNHLLNRPERVRLREEASALNVYDLGWRRNIRELLIRSGQRGVTSYLSCFWPLGASRDR